MDFETIRVRQQENICFIQLYRPNDNNTINERMIEECHQALDLYKESATIVVFEGLPETFCFGADFKEMYEKSKDNEKKESKPELLYELWLKVFTGPFITIANVKGKVNAGGIGFVAACDIVIADQTAKFSLSELLFGIYPAAVFPFLVNKIGLQKANYFTLMTQPLSVETAYSYGLVDAWEPNSSSLLRKHILRLKVLSKRGIQSYKQYRKNFSSALYEKEPIAIEANKRMFSDAENLKGIFNFVETGVLPWDK